MTDEAKLHRQASRGERARRIIEDELVVEAFAKIEAGIVDIFKQTAISDDATRRQARESLGLLTNLREQLRQTIVTGDFSAKELLRIQEESKLKRLIHGRR